MFANKNERNEWMIDQYMAGKTIKELANELGLSIPHTGNLIRSQRERAISMNIGVLITAVQINDNARVGEAIDNIFKYSTLRNNQGGKHE